jgi:hypothetical protein
VLIGGSSSASGPTRILSFFPARIQATIKHTESAVALIFYLNYQDGITTTFKNLFVSPPGILYALQVIHNGTSPSSLPATPNPQIGSLVPSRDDIR